MEKPIFSRGGSGSRGVNAAEFEKYLVDLLDVYLYKNFKKDSTKTNHQDITFNSNDIFWKHLFDNKGYINQYVTLSDFFLTEWIPMSPGLFHTDEASNQRHLAERFAVRNFDFDDESPTHHGLKKITVSIDESHVIKNRVPTELLPHGKRGMILGGIGALRLSPKKFYNEEPMFIFGASSSGICHEGIPVLIPQGIYNDLIPQIKDNCGVKCDIIGTLQILHTDNSPIIFHREIPKYCLLVEEVAKVKQSNPNDILVSIAISYADNPHYRYWGDRNWSFVSFIPDTRDRQLELAAEWLQDYAKRYSHDRVPRITADFDEYKQHFDAVDISVKDVANGTFNITDILKYTEHIEIKHMTIMENSFNNNSNTTIVNESYVENSFNKVKDTLGDETAAVLKQIAEIVEKSNNPQAGEVFNAFNEELQKPEPKKSILGAFWSSLTTLIPTISSAAGIVEKVASIIG